MKKKSVSQCAVIGLFVVLSFALCDSSARADSTNWVATTGDWFVDANWSNHIPTISTDAFINNGGTAQINSSDAQAASAASLTLGLNQGDSGTLHVDGANASLGLPCTVDISGNLFPGLISVGYSGQGTLTITNGGAVSSEWGYIAAVANSSLPNSNGSVTVDGAGSIWTISSPCGSAARLFVGGSYIEGVGDDPGGIALLSVTNGGEVLVDNPADQTSVKVGLSGTLTGNGSIKTVVHPPHYLDTAVAVQGTLAPSWTLNIDGDLYLVNGATTQCNVTPGNLGMVDCSVSRTGNLNGHLSVIMNGTFTAGTTFTLLHADGGVNGTFTSVSITNSGIPTYTPMITYDANNVYLYLHP